MRKNIRTILVLIIALGIFFVGFASFQIINMWVKAKPKKSDCIIILGCMVRGTTPSPMLQARLNEGIRLHNEGYAEHIIVSGGQGPGEDITEAEAMEKYLISKGINKSKIIKEDKSRSTFENLVFSKKKMEQYGFKTALIISNKYHLKRASLMAEKNGIMASYSGVFLSQYKWHEAYGFLRETIALWKFYILGV